MRDMTLSDVERYYSKNFVGQNSPNVWVSVQNVVLDNVKSLSVNREENVLPMTASVTLSNVNPYDWTDTGYYNQQRDDTAHGKPANTYYELIQPGKQLTIAVDYGSTSNVIFTGYIDTVEANISEAPELVISARDIGKYLVDNTIWCEDTSSGSEILYEISYPIDVGITTIYLTAADTNPYLYEIFIDACMRAGISITNIDVGDSPETTFPLKLDSDSVNGDFFDELSGTWKSLVDYICKLLVADVYVNKSGDICLRKKLVTAPDADAYKGIILNGTSYTNIGIEDNYRDRAVESTIRVSNIAQTTFYTKDLDFEYDYLTNSIRRTSDSTITDGQNVLVYQKYVNWIFEQGKSIFNLKQWVSHDDMYGKIVATNDEEDLKVEYTMPSYGDGSTVSANKIYKEDLPELLTEYRLETWINDKAEEMRRNYWQCKAEVLPITQLEIHDLVQFIIYGTIGGLYSIRGIDWVYSADSGHTCNLKTSFVCNA